MTHEEVGHKGTCCRHTFKPHRWVSVGKVTRLDNGRSIDWHRCRSCGAYQAREYGVEE